jgi:hypothetical protein
MPSNLPFIDPNPNAQTDWLNAQYQQALAQGLIGQSQQPNQGGMAGQVYVGPSFTQGLARMLQAYSGGKMMTGANETMGRLLGQQWGNIRAGMGGQQPSQQPSQHASYDSSQIGQNAPTDYGLLNRQPIQNTPQQQLPEQPSQGIGQGRSFGNGGLNPLGYPPDVATVAFATDPAKYAETVLTQSAPTDLMKTLRAQGIEPGTPQWTAAMQANVAKTNQPAGYRPGSIVPRADGTYAAMPGAAPEGSRNIQGSDGNWYVVPMGGGAAAISGAAAARKGGETSATLYESVDPRTGKKTMIPGTEFQNPPAAMDVKPGRFGGYSGGQGGPITALPTGTSDLATQGAKRIGDTISAANESKMRVNVIDNILSASQNGVQTGPTEDWKNKIYGMIASVPGADKIGLGGLKDDVSRFQEITKFIKQNALRQWQAAGGTGTDSQLEASVEANLRTGLFPKALQDIAQWSKAAELAVQAKAAAQQQWVDQGNSPLQQSKFETAWRNNFDPKVYQMVVNPQKFASDPQFKNPQTGQLTPAGQALLKKYMTAKQNGWFEQ